MSSTMQASQCVHMTTLPFAGLVVYVEDTVEVTSRIISIIALFADLDIVIGAYAAATLVISKSQM
jgi:hypothetical protein